MYIPFYFVSLPLSFWSRESIIFKLHETVSHEYFPHYVYKQVMYINFIFISPMHGVASREVKRIARFLLSQKCCLCLHLKPVYECV